MQGAQGAGCRLRGVFAVGFPPRGDIWGVKLGEACCERVPPPQEYASTVRRAVQSGSVNLKDRLTIELHGERAPLKPR